MQSKFALRALAAADLAPQLSDQVQDLYQHQLAIARQATIQQSRQLIADALETLPPPFAQSLTDEDLSQLINQFIY